MPDEIEKDIYSKEGREQEVEDDEIEPWEAAFVEGSEEEEAKCKTCGKILMGPDQVVEREVDDKVLWFCSEECADNYQ